MKPTNSSPTASAWMPGALCVLLSVTAAWLAVKCFQHEQVTVRPSPSAIRAQTLPSKMASAIAASDQRSPKQPAGSASGHFSAALEYTLARAHPEYLDFCATSFEEDFAVDYAPLFRILRLSPEQRAALLRALVDRRMSSILGRSGDPEDLCAASQNVFALRGQIEDELKKELPSAAFGTFLFYDRLGVGSRDNLNDMGEYLAFRGQPLTTEQERAVYGVIESARNNPAEMELIGKFYKTGILDDLFLQRMGAFLTKDQLRLALATTHEKAAQRQLGLKQAPARVKYN